MAEAQPGSISMGRSDETDKVDASRCCGEIEALNEEALHLAGSSGGVPTDDAASHWEAIGKLAPTALCLSGGGIRSATFCLGVLQGLAKAGKLEDFHYLSTVSGGGYIGSWLSRWRAQGSWSQDKMGESATVDNAPAEHPVRQLRSFSNYMSPTWGLSGDARGVVTLFLRNLLLNLLIWIPLVLLVAAIPRAGIALAVELRAPGDVVAWATFGLPVLLALIWSAIAVATALVPYPNEQLGERLANQLGVVLIAALGLLLMFGLFVHLPLFALHKFDTWRQSAAVVGLGSTAIALLTAVLGYWSRYGTDIRERVTSFAGTVGFRLLDLLAAVSLAIIAFGASIALHFLIRFTLPYSKALFGEVAKPGAGRPLSDAFLGELTAPDGWQPLLLVATALLVILAVAALRVKVNRFSLHALYRNRLVRAYLGSARPGRAPLGGDEHAEDDIAMSKLDGGRAAEGEPSRRLFHVVNLTLNLARPSARRRDWQERKAAPFTATPLRCGSPIVGYAPSAHYGGGMKLGRAMAISGAAASPNMGYFGSPLMAMVMTFFNVRLGWWLPNPRKGKKEPEPRIGLVQMFAEAFGWTHEDADWLYLSDGGHFDNLGLYEMIRRRCRRIVVVDGGCDGMFDYADLHNAVRKIEIDFGVSIDLPSTLPGQKGVGEKQRVFVARIGYSALGGFPDGQLIYLKPMLTGSEPASLISYAATSRRGTNTFPHHSTLDQFFDETQFESYRRLGEVSAEDLVGALAPPPRRSRPKSKAAAASNPHYPLLAPLDGDSPPGRADAYAGDAGQDRAGDRARDDRRGSDASPPAAVLPAIRGISSSLNEMGTTRLIITTLAAAGSLGAAAAVGQKAVDAAVPPAAPTPAAASTPPARIGLSDEAKTALASGVPITGMKEVEARLLALQYELGKLNIFSVGASFGRALAGAGAGTTNNTTNTTMIDATQVNSILTETNMIKTQLQRIEGQLPPADLGPITARMRNVETLLAQLVARPSLTKADLETQYQRIRGEIDTVKQDLQRVSDRVDPRRNVRSQ